MLWTIFMSGQSDELQERAAPDRIAESLSADLAVPQLEVIQHGYSHGDKVFRPTKG